MIVRFHPARLDAIDLSDLTRLGNETFRELRPLGRFLLNTADAEAVRRDTEETDDPVEPELPELRVETWTLRQLQQALEILMPAFSATDSDVLRDFYMLVLSAITAAIVSASEPAAAGCSRQGSDDSHCTS